MGRLVSKRKQWHQHHFVPRRQKRRTARWWRRHPTFIRDLLHEGLHALRVTAVMPRLVSQEHLPYEHGSTIDVPIPSLVHETYMSPREAYAHLRDYKNIHPEKEDILRAAAQLDAQTKWEDPCAFGYE